MKCIKCGQEMVNISGGNYQCPSCGQAIDDLVYRQPLINPNDYQIAIHCMICGKEVVRTAHPPVSVSELIKVCDDCKKAIAWAKERMQWRTDQVKIDNYVTTDEGYREVGENEIIVQKSNYAVLGAAECGITDAAIEDEKRPIDVKKAEQEAVRDFAKIIMSIIFEDEKDEMMKIRDFHDTIRDVLRMNYGIELEDNDE